MNKLPENYIYPEYETESQIDWVGSNEPNIQLYPKTMKRHYSIKAEPEIILYIDGEQFVFSSKLELVEFISNMSTK